MTFSSCFSPEYVAMYTYESNEQGDLSFQQGDIVVVTRKEGDWWTGMVGGKTGVFPSNYVKPRDSVPEVETFVSDYLVWAKIIIWKHLQDFILFIYYF